MIEYKKGVYTVALSGNELGLIRYHLGIIACGKLEMSISTFKSLANVTKGENKRNHQKAYRESLRSYKQLKKFVDKLEAQTKVINYD